MKQKLFACALLLLSTFGALAQADFVINKSKVLKTEYTPVPKDFKTKKISWGAVGSFCGSDSIHYGAWFRVYPAGNQLKVTVSTGFNWGNLSDPLIYVAYLDTVNGVETLEPLGCDRFAGAQGDFTLEVFGLHPKKKHFMLIGANAKKEKFALYLTEKFQPTVEEEETPAEAEEEIKGSEKIIDAEQAAEEAPSGKSERLNTQAAAEEGAIIIGRVRKRNGKPITDFDLALLNDGLEETATTTTDEYGVFKIEGIDPSSINLVRTSQDDANVLIDMFIYNRDGNIIGKPISLGHNLFSFKANEPESNQLRILTDQDMVVMVKRGKSTMTGKVVDRETFLIGKEGVRVGLYTPRKSLLRSAITDRSGAFLFTQLDQEEYIVKVDHKPDSDYVEMVLLDDENEPYAMSNSDDQSADGYFRFRKLAKQSIDMETMEMSDESGFKHHYYTMLSEEEPGVPYELHSIVFESGASDLSRQNDELDQLARELTESPEIAIKIDGHTDNVGEVRANQSLSLKRAEAVKAYLVSKGVSSKRISCQGYGAVKPIATNATVRGRSLNRRVEFSIVEE